LHNLCMGATANSKSVIKTTSTPLFLFNAVFNLFYFFGSLTMPFQFSSNNEENYKNAITDKMATRFQE
ncbi:MAG: hypothetical protein N3E52_00005, partial [Candidatus Bathyarchaeota archaeon]|nr:hypothetical protein [Candidatus Bathyarchaeota archaeon]